MDHDGCIGCVYENELENSKKCKGCRCTFLSKYSPKGKKHDGCQGCDHEHTDRNNSNCIVCMYNAPDKYKPRKQNESQE